MKTAHNQIALGTSRRRRFIARTRNVDGITIEMVDKQGSAIPFECYDLSAVGVYLYSDLLMTEGEHIDLCLNLPSTRGPIAVKGVVVRADLGEGDQDSGMGIVFKDLGHDVRQELRKYVARRFMRHVNEG